MGCASWFIALMTSSSTRRATSLSGWPLAGSGSSNRGAISAEPSAVGTDPVPSALGSAEIAPRFDEPLPASGHPLNEVARRVELDVMSAMNQLAHPMCMGHQVSAPLPIAVWMEPVIAAMNQSVAVAEMSPSATVLETQLIRWMAGLIGWHAES